MLHVLSNSHLYTCTHMYSHTHTHAHTVTQTYTHKYTWMHTCWRLIIWSYIAVHCSLQYCTVSDHGCLHEIKIHGTGMCNYVRHFSVQRKRSVSWTDFKKCGNGNWLLLEGCAKWCNLLALKQAKCHCMYTLSVYIVAVEEEGKPLFALWHWAVNSRIRFREREKSAAW